MSNSSPASPQRWSRLVHYPRPHTLRCLFGALVIASLTLQLMTPGAQAATLAPACGFAEIRGVVTAEDTGLPLADVSVSAFGSKRGESATTDTTGTYTLTVPYYLDPGPYSVSFYPSIDDETVSSSYVEAPITTTQVLSGGTTIVDSVMSRGAVIRGQVKTADTDARMEGVLVIAYRETEDGFIISDSARSDADGNFLIKGLKSGDYTLEYDSVNLFSTPAILEYETGYLGRVNYASEATQFTVTIPQTKTVDFTIPRGREITGEIRRSDTSEIAAAIGVYAFLLDEDGAGRGAFIRVSDGSPFGIYEIGSLAPGKYLLAALPYRTENQVGDGAQYANYDLEFEWYKDVLTSDEATVVEIPEAASSDPISVNMTLSPGAVITGVVTDGNTGAPVPDILVEAVGRSPLGQLGITFGHASRMITNEDGVFAIPGLADGTYQLAYSPADFDSDYATRGNSSTQEFTVTVAGTEVHPNANFTIQRGGVIAGKLTDDQDDPVADIEVTLSAAESGFFAGRTTSDASGNYTFSKIAPGQYRVKFDRFDPCGCYNNEYYVGDGSGGSGLVTVAAGETTTGINSKMACNPAPPPYSVYLPNLSK